MKRTFALALFSAVGLFVIIGSGIAPSAYNLVQNGGTPLTRRSTLNCTGSGITCADNAGAKRTDITVPGVANYQQAFTAQTSVALTHNFNTTLVLAQCFDASNAEVIPNTTTITSVNVVTVTFLIAQDGYCNVNGSSSAASMATIFDIWGPWLPGGTLGSALLKNEVIPAGNTVDLLPAVSGAGYVSEIFLATNQYSTNIIVTVDGEGSPSISDVWINILGDVYQDSEPGFFGHWISANNGGSAGAYAGTFRLPIPFGSSVRVQVKNNDPMNPATVTGYVAYHTAIPDTWPYTQRLKTVSVLVDGIAANAETNILNVTTGKPGRLAGVSWLYDGNVGNAVPRTAPLEGPFKIYVDGGAAGYITSGTEDFFGMGFYFRNTVTFGSGVNDNLAPGSTNNVFMLADGGNVFGAQRWFYEDPIRFQNAIRLTWTCGNTTAVAFTGTCRLAGTAYYYVEN